MQNSIRRDAEPAPVPDTVRLCGVGFGYADRPGVLRDVSLSLKQGSFHFLTGPSGAGKSSLLRLLTLAERPQSGRVRLFGQDVTFLPHSQVPQLRRRIGVVFQDFRLLDHLSAFENAALPLILSGESQAQYQADVAEMLRWVGLGKRMDARPPSLSGGEKQRLAIARAVITRPALILADEPTGSVDRAMGDKLMHLFTSLNRLGATVLIATHDETMVSKVGGGIGANVLHLEQGQLSLVHKAEVSA